MEVFDMLKKIVNVLLVFVMLFSLSACENNSIATIDGEKIDTEYFQYYFTELKHNMQQQYGEDAWQEATLDGKSALEYVRERALQSVIEDKLVMMKAKEDNIKLTDEDKESIKTVKKQWIDSYGSESAFKDAIKSMYGISVGQFDYMLEAVYYRKHIVEKYVNDDMSRDFYNKNIAKVKHILIPTIDLATNLPLTGDKLEASNKKLALVLAEIQKGTDFDSLVAKYTEDQDEFYYVGEGFSFNYDGSFGSGMVEEFEKASFSLNVGEISGVVETQFGYHIIKRYENDEAMYRISEDSLSDVAFSQVIEEWKTQKNIVKNESVYNSFI